MQKYKVFINERWIFFGDFYSEQFTDNEDCMILDFSPDLICNFIEMIKSRRFNSNIIIRSRGKAKEAFDFFLEQFLVLKAAGGLVQNENKDFLMIKRFGFWDFPKGKIEQGESVEEAALREVEEETAVRELTIIRTLPEAYHIYQFRGKWIVKINYWFLMYSNYSGPLIPQKEEDILEAIWVPEKKLESHLSHSYASLREMVYNSDLI